jgi:periplasmic divalent cation tolerance protein
VKARLAASAQVVGPLTSVFWHLGELGSGTEWQVLLRTTRERYFGLATHLVETHPWDNPEITATELTEASPRYCEWVRKETAA